MGAGDAWFFIGFCFAIWITARRCNHCGEYWFTKKKD